MGTGSNKGACIRDCEQEQQKLKDLVPEALRSVSELGTQSLDLASRISGVCVRGEGSSVLSSPSAHIPQMSCTPTRTSRKLLAEAHSTLEPRACFSRLLFV